MSRTDNKVWHCKNAYSKVCRENCFWCRGTDCKKYEPYKDSYHWFKENDPINGKV